MRHILLSADYLSESDGYEIMWGGGLCKFNSLLGGLYMASSVSDSCAVWNCQIGDSRKWSDDQVQIVGKGGDIDHLRSHIPETERKEDWYFNDDGDYVAKVTEIPIQQMMEKDTLYWITDRTPHEALPNNTGQPVYRQFFRLVTADVSVWFEDHSTPNPNGVVPDPEITKILKGNKFEIMIPRQILIYGRCELQPL